MNYNSLESMKRKNMIRNKNLKLDNNNGVMKTRDENDPLSSNKISHYPKVFQNRNSSFTNNSGKKQVQHQNNYEKNKKMINQLIPWYIYNLIF